MSGMLVMAPDTVYQLVFGGPAFSTIRDQCKSARGTRWGPRWPFCAPPCLLPEVFELLHANYREGVLDLADVRKIIRAIEGLPIYQVELSLLSDSVSKLTDLDISLSDALYVATAIHTRATLLTSRARLTTIAIENDAEAILV